MGVTQVRARIYGENETREYTFLVDTGSTYLALPIEQIRELGLSPTGGRVELISATGPVEVDTYFARGELMGRIFGALAVPSTTMLIGYELLENLRFRVNPVLQRIERVPSSEFHPPFLL